MGEAVTEVDAKGPITVAVVGGADGHCAPGDEGHRGILVPLTEQDKTVHSFGSGLTGGFGDDANGDEAG